VLLGVGQLKVKAVALIVEQQAFSVSGHLEAWIFIQRKPQSLERLLR
jgi:hypothetical protein